VSPAKKKERKQGELRNKGFQEFWRTYHHFEALETRQKSGHQREERFADFVIRELL
jgi:hypothetical protein